MPTIRPSLLCVMLAMGALSGVPAMAATVPIPILGFGKNLSAADQQLLSQAVRQALEAGKAGASADWSDDSTGHAGRATVLRVYQKGDAPCGAVEHVFTKGDGDRYELPFCRQPDGSWKIAF
ncbi:MAG TPA: hypothetical protein VIM56_00985 [Rhizomicrobium sp.]